MPDQKQEDSTANTARENNIEETDNFNYLVVNIAKNGGEKRIY